MNKTQELAMKKLADVMEYDIDLDNWDVTNLMLCASAQISRLKEENHNMEILLGDKWHPVPKGMTILPEVEVSDEQKEQAIKDLLNLLGKIDKILLKMAMRRNDIK